MPLVVVVVWGLQLAVSLTDPAGEQIHPDMRPRQLDGHIRIEDARRGLPGRDGKSKDEDKVQTLVPVPLLLAKRRIRKRKKKT